MKGFFVSLLIALTFVGTIEKLSAQENDEQVTINWLTWEEAVERSKAEPRKIVMDVYTDWCKWCKRMDEVTFQQPDIARYINENFYAVRFDAEQREDVEFHGKSYKFVNRGINGYHELAAEFLRGRLSYPSVVFLDENLDVIQSIAGFKTPEQFARIATFFGNDRYKNTPWSTYQKSFVPRMTLIKDED